MLKSTIKFWPFIFIMYLYPKLNAQINTSPVPKVPDQGEDDDLMEVDDLEGVEDPSFGASSEPKNETVPEPAINDLEDTNEENRRQFEYGLALAIGVTAPWQSISVAGQYHLNERVGLDWSTGKGEWKFFGERSAKPYEINATATASTLGVRYYFIHIAPLYIQPSLGYAILSGDIKPTGSVKDQEATENLNTGFDVSGIVLGLNLGFSVFWKTGIFIDYTLMGVAKTFVTSSEYTTDNKDAAAAVKDTLNSPTTWGFLNIKVGYFF